MASFLQKYSLMCSVLLVIFLATSACSKNNDHFYSSKENQILYEGISDPAIMIFSRDKMYSGFPPADKSGSDFRNSFFSIVKIEDKSSGNQCLFPAPPLDENRSTIAIGVPAKMDFSGQFVCGKFRFEVKGCEDFSINCGYRFIRAFRIKDNDLVSSYFWDRCKGVYLLSSGDLSKEGGWIHAFLPAGEKRLFADRSDTCLEL